MMINCPKCNLLQPKDQYCAQCGINMETWKPPPTPKWKKLISNWIFQLGVLFAVVLGVVLQDNFTNQPAQNNQNSLPPVNDRIARSEESQNMQSQSSFQETQAPSPSRSQTIEQQRPQQPTMQEDVENAPTPQIKRVAVLRVAMMSRSLIEKLSQESQRVDDSALIIGEADFNQITRSMNRDIQAIGSTRQKFQFNQELPIFVGEEDLETGLNLGFFFQLNVIEKMNQDTVRLQARSWSQLQLNGDSTPQVSYEVQLPTNSIFIAIDPLLHDLSFTEEERSLFEASQRLRLLNEDVFLEELSDIVLVLTIK